MLSVSSDLCAEFHDCIQRLTDSQNHEERDFETLNSLEERAKALSELIIAEAQSQQDYELIDMVREAIKFVLLPEGSRTNSVDWQISADISKREFHVVSTRNPDNKNKMYPAIYFSPAIFHLMEVVFKNNKGNVSIGSRATKAIFAVIADRSQDGLITLSELKQITGYSEGGIIGNISFLKKLITSDTGLILQGSKENGWRLTEMRAS